MKSARGEKEEAVGEKLGRFLIFPLIQFPVRGRLAAEGD